MKKRHRPPFNHALMTVPVAAMMLGASQSQALTSIGVNFWGSYGSANDSNNGRVVSDQAFGLAAADWTTSYTPDSPDPATWTYDSYVTSGTFIAGPVTVDYTAGSNFFTGTNPARSPDLTPGETDILNGAIYAGDSEGPDGAAGFTVTLSDLAATFPNGYVIRPIVTGNEISSFAPLTVSDDGGVTTQNLDYSVVHTTGGYYGPTSVQWSVGAVSTPLDGDTLTLSGPGDDDTSASGLAGLIITDKPVIMEISPETSALVVGESFTLSVDAIGIGTLSYQWRRDGVDIPGATSPNYTVAAATAVDSGSYSVVVSSSAFPANPATSPTVTVGVTALETWTGSASNAWNTTALNWQHNGVPSAHSDGLTSRFNADSTVNNVVLSAAVAPASVQFLGDTDYSITGSGSIGGAGGIVKDGASYVSISTVNSFTGDTTIAAGVLSIDGAGTLGAATYPGNIVNNGELVLGSSASQTFTGVISGSGQLTKLGSGTLTTAGNNSATGTTVVEEGTLEVLQKSLDSPYVVLAEGTLKLGYSTDPTNANTRLDLQGNGVSATTGLYLKGGTIYNVAGGLTLTGAPTTIRQYGSGPAGLGIWDIHATGLVCDSSASGSVIDANIELVRVGYGMALQVDPGEANATGDLIVNGPLNIDDGGFGLIKRGEGSLRLNAAATPENDALEVQAGNVIAGTDQVIGADADLSLTTTGATLTLGGTSQSVKKLNGNGRIIGGSATPATLTVNPAEDPIDTVPDAAFEGTLGGAGPLEDNFSLIKAGLHTLTLNGTATLSGTTTVSGGILVAGSLPNSAVTVADTAILFANGTLASLNVATGGSVSPAGTAPGAVTTSGNVTLAGFYDCDIAGSGSDRISAGGNLSITGATLDLHLAGAGATQSSYVIASYTGTLTGTFGTVTGLPAGYSVNYNTTARQIELVSNSAPTGYAGWIAGYFPGQTDPSIVGATADPDHDGQPNSLEFALGGAPNSPVNNAKIFALAADSSADADSTKELLLTIAVRAGTPTFGGSPSPTATLDGYVYKVEGSSDLSSFPATVLPVDPVTTDLPPVPAGYQYRTFSLSGSNGTPSKGFLRVSVTP